MVSGILVEDIIPKKGGQCSFYLKLPKIKVFKKKIGSKIDTTKWYAEEYIFEIEVTGFLRSDHTENYCRNGEEIGDKYVCTYGCPVNEQGYGICSKMMQLLYGDMQAVRSGGDLTLVGGTEPFVKDYVCPDGCVCFQMRAVKTENENFYKGKFYQES